jgi:hypothetical protein
MIDKETKVNWQDYYKNLDYICRGDDIFYISLDTEYTQETRYKNVCLSYQISILRASDSAYREIFLDIKNDERLTLEELLDTAFELYGVYDDRESLKVILIAHNSVAEFAMLKDRDKYIPNLLTIRKTLTSKKSIDVSGKYSVDLYDSMLIAPVGYYSLKKLSTILGDDNMLKIEIKQSEIENMDRFKRNNPDLFREYAMQDSRVTLAVWLMLQKQYNELVYDIKNEDGKNSFETIQRLFSTNIIKNHEDSASLTKIIGSINNRGTSAYKVDKFYKTLGEASVRAFFTYVHSVETPDVLNDEHSYMKDLAKQLDGGINADVFKLKKYLNKNDVDLYSIKANEVFQRFTAKFPWKIHGSNDEIFDKKFINDIYFGGRNESFYVGYTKDDPKIADDYVFIDLDFAGAYPTAMTTIPLIDWEQGILEEVQGNDFIDRWYTQSKSIDADNVTSIVGFVDVEFIFPSEIMYPCLPVKHDKYGLIYPLEGKTLATASEIIFATQIIEEVRNIVLQSEEYKKLEEALAITINDDEKQSIKIAMERRLGYIKALRSVELVPYQRDNHPDLLLKRYFKNKIEKRNGYKIRVKTSSDENEKNIANLNDKLLKEFVNTLYGKTAQAVNPKNVFDIGTGKSVPLKYSTMTAPYVASTTTGIVRAALSALIYAIESYNRQHASQKPIILISATTDGALFGVPIDLIDSSIPTENINTQKFEHLLPIFASTLEDYYPTRLLKDARYSVAGDSYLEIKHVATEIYSIKTRGQIGFFENEDGEKSTTVLAKFGHKPPLSELYEREEYKAIMSDSIKRNNADAKWLIEQMQTLSGKIETYPVRSLIGIKKILDANDPTEDLVGRDLNKKMNYDYDYKRHLTSISPYTKPFKSLKEMLKYRYAMENIRKRGLNAKPELIEAKIQMNSSFSRMRGSMYDHALKIFLRALFLHDYYLDFAKKLKGLECVEKINRFIGFHNIPAKFITIDTVKNAKRTKFEANSIPRVTSVISFTKELHQLFGIEFDNTKRRLLLTHDSKRLEEEGHHSSELQAMENFLKGLFVAISGEYGHARVFSDLKLPEIEVLEEDIVGRLQNTSLMFDAETIKKCMSIAKQARRMEYNKVPNTSVARNVIKELRIAILSYIPRDAKKDKYIGKAKYKYATSDFYKILLEQVYEAKSQKNPSKAKCLKYFCIALTHKIAPFDTIEHQYDIVIMDRLKYFGLTKSKFYKYKQDKFIYKALKNTPENRKQIKQMYTELCKNSKSDSDNQPIRCNKEFVIENLYEVLLEG